MDITPGKMQQLIRERLLVISRTIPGSIAEPWHDLICLGDAIDALPEHLREEIAELYGQHRCGAVRQQRLFK